MNKVSIYANGVSVVNDGKKITVSGLQGGGGGGIKDDSMKVGAGGAIGQHIYYPNNGGNGKNSIEVGK